MIYDKYSFHDMKILDLKTPTQSIVHYFKGKTNESQSQSYTEDEESAGQINEFNCCFAGCGFRRFLVETSVGTLN